MYLTSFYTSLLLLDELIVSSVLSPCRVSLPMFCFVFKLIAAVCITVAQSKMPFWYNKIYLILSYLTRFFFSHQCDKVQWFAWYLICWISQK